MRAFIDKIEGKQAELRLGEDESIKLVLPLSELPKGLREGDVLALRFERDPHATQAEGARADAQREALLERSKDEPL
jgi:hypothetical protein